jgi:hypothetical protein
MSRKRRQTKSERELMQCMGVDAETAGKAWDLMKWRTDPPGRWDENAPDDYPQTRAWLRQCFHEPNDLDRRLAALDELLGTHGVEACGPAFEYLNAGDAYNLTVIYSRKTDSFRLGCWGDIVEREDTRGEW